MSLFGDDQHQNQQECQPKFESKEAKEALKLVDDKSSFGLLYKTICSLLISRKVPTTRFPTKEHVLSRVVEFVDLEKFNGWLDKYIELEAMQLEPKDDPDDPDEGGGDI